jgi:hypothetical protein
MVFLEYDFNIQFNSLYITNRITILGDVKRGSAATRLLGLRVLIPPAAWTFVYCGRCVLSGRCPCDGPITRPEESQRA